MNGILDLARFKVWKISFFFWIAPRCGLACILELFSESLCCLFVAYTITDLSAASSLFSYMATVCPCTGFLCTSPAACLCGWRLLFLFLFPLEHALSPPHIHLSHMWTLTLCASHSTEKFNWEVWWMWVSSKHTLIYFFFADTHCLYWVTHGCHLFKKPSTWIYM